MLSTVGVVGAGLMGRGIAGVFAAHGAEVRVFDVDASALRATVSALATDGAHVRAVDSLAEVVRGADLVTEAVAEALDVKQSVFAELAAADETAILATNTSVLPVTRIAANARHPERVVGTHWWNPPELIPIVEVVRGERTDEAVVDRVVAALAAVGKTPVRVRRDVPGFVGNRMQHALWREAISLVADGTCDAETVDLVVRGTIGLRLATMGPIENADFVGLDLTLAIHEAVLPAINREAAPSPVLRELVRTGQLGAKTGEGFLRWAPGDRAAAAARLAAHVRDQLSERARGNAAPAEVKENP